MAIAQARGVDRDKLSPMMRHYLETKDRNPDCILFYRLGDFYEMFFDDAVTVSKALELTLTGKSCGLEDRAAMCGIPFHAAESYIKKLVDLGYKVAVCEQLTDPKEATGLVERDIVRIVTPGTIVESSMLDETENNFLACICYNKEEKAAGLCFADISTGACYAYNVSGRDISEKLIGLITRYTPSEILSDDNFPLLANVMNFIRIQTAAVITPLSESDFDIRTQRETVLAQFSAGNFEELGIDTESMSARAISGMFSYIRRTQCQLSGRFTEINFDTEDIYMYLDFRARRNLELCETMRSKEKKGSLLGVLDSTCTTMGKRMLRSWIQQPLVSAARIMGRLDAVEALINSNLTFMEIRETLGSVYDLERLMTRVMYRTATPRDMRALCVTASVLPRLKSLLASVEGSRLLRVLNERISDLGEITDLLERAVEEDPPVNYKDGGVIKQGFDKDLDELRSIMNGGEEIVRKIEEEERERTGIKNLKIGFNRVFGYYLEVTRSYYSLIPENYIRKQTLANSERFITEELKAVENKILGAKERSLALESDLFVSLRDFLAARIKPVQETAEAVSEVDVLCSFAETAIQNNYSKPEISADGSIQITNGRHPVVESLLTDELFVPNDTYIDNRENRLAIITGPNMSGKSTYMRQVAIITLMAQMGSFVPADYAKISVCDRIFTRVGASDDLAGGQSTFMVEMQEVSDILKYATHDSLVILDEVGRGTSTSDGVSIAEAVAEYISQTKSLSCKTLFATHYHELIGLEKKLPGVHNLSVAVKKSGDTIKFLRKIVPGGADESYGIEVAKLAGIPKKVTDKAKEKLAEYELERLSQKKEADRAQISFADIERERELSVLKRTNVDELTDTECREMLIRLQNSVRG